MAFISGIKVLDFDGTQKTIHMVLMVGRKFRPKVVHKIN
jgi:hypothetical protein